MQNFTRSLLLWSCPSCRIPTQVWSFCLPRAGVGCHWNSLSAESPKGIPAPFKCCFHQSSQAESVFKQSAGALLLLWHWGETHPMETGHKWLVGGVFILSASWPVEQPLPYSPFFRVLASMSSLERRGRKSRIFCFEIIRSLGILSSHLELWVLYGESQSSSPRHFLTKYWSCGRICLLGSVFLQLREANPSAVCFCGASGGSGWCQVSEESCRGETQTHKPKSSPGCDCPGLSL